MLLPLQLTLIFFPTHPRITMSFCAFAAPMQVVTAAMCSWCQQPCHTQKAALHGTPPHSPALTVFTPSRRGALILHLFMKWGYELLLNNFKSPAKLCYVLSICILIGIFYTRYFFLIYLLLWYHYDCYCFGLTATFSSECLERTAGVLWVSEAECILAKYERH